MWHLVFSTCCMLACLGHTAADWGPHGDFIIGAKGTRFLDKALDAYPLELQGKSQYDTNYTLSEACYNGMLGYYVGVAYRRTWAGRMADSDGVPASGMADGAINWPGNYEGCLRVEATGEEVEVPEVGVITHDFDAKYCRAYTYYEGFWPPITMGFCVPETCTEDDVTHMLIVGNGSVPVFRLYCGDDKQEYKDDAGAIVATVILCIFGVVILSATLLDYFMEWRKERYSKVDKASTEQAFSNHTCDGTTVAVPNGESPTVNTAAAAETVTATTVVTTNGQMQLNGSVEGEGIVGENNKSSDFTLTVDGRTQHNQETLGLLSLDCPTPKTIVYI